MSLTFFIFSLVVLFRETKFEDKKNISLELALGKSTLSITWIKCRLSYLVFFRIDNKWNTRNEYSHTFIILPSWHSLELLSMQTIFPLFWAFFSFFPTSQQGILVYIFCPLVSSFGSSWKMIHRWFILNARINTPSVLKSEDLKAFFLLIRIYSSIYISCNSWRQ